jgi:hypothetical protein
MTTSRRNHIEIGIPYRPANVYKDPAYPWNRQPIGHTSKDTLDRLARFVEVDEFVVLKRPRVGFARQRIDERVRPREVTNIPFPNAVLKIEADDIELLYIVIKDLESATIRNQFGAFTMERPQMRRSAIG